jgi:hypothetical protein
MDLRAYYKTLRQVESELPTPYVVIVSKETPDGGKSGTLTEVSRFIAAKQIVEGRARIATFEESECFHQHNDNARQAAEQELAVSKMQFVVVPSRTGLNSQKE